MIAEIQAKVRAAEQKSKTKGGGRLSDHVWEIVCRAFRDWGVGESMVALLDMAPPLVAEFGPVDVSLTELAKRAVAQGARGVILTNDGRLLNRCRSEEVSAELAWDELERFRAAS